MTTLRLRSLLGELREELDRTEALDAEGTELLQGIHDEIEGIIDTAREEREPQGALDRLRASIDQFEGSHPTLTAVIQRITDVLAGAGL